MHGDWYAEVVTAKVDDQATCFAKSRQVYHKSISTTWDEKNAVKEAIEFMFQKVKDVNVVNRAIDQFNKDPTTKQKLTHDFVRKVYIKEIHYDGDRIIWQYPEYGQL